MKKYFLFIIAILFPMMLVAQTNSQWRGVNRDGIYQETGLLRVWPEAGPELLWSFEGLGDGYTSVAVANAKVYVTGIEDDNLNLFVFDLSGRLLNKKTVGKEWNGRFQGTRCTVLVHEGKLYIGNSLGQLFCLDEATLNEIWKKDGLSDFDGRNIMFGVTENPLIVGDKIFMTPGGVTNNVVALNKDTGALIWSSTGTGNTSTYSSPIYISGYSVPLVVTYLSTGVQQDRIYQNHLIAFNANTGEVVWSLPQPSANDINPNTPIYNNGYIYSTMGYGGGAWLLRLTNDGRAIEQVWHNSSADNQHHGPVKVGDYVYTTAQNGRAFFCLEWRTGEIKWREANHRQASMVYADGMLFAYDDNGGMSLIRPNPERFELLSKFQITMGTEQHWAHPVINNGVMYIRHGDALMAYKVR